MTCFNQIIRMMGYFVASSLLQMGCLVLDENHCLANGGDLACPGQRCLFETGRRVHTQTDDFGCSYIDANFSYHVHLTYGMPASFEMGGESDNLDTVEGILAALWEDDGAGSCPLDSPDRDDALDDLEDVYTDVHALRLRFEARGRVRASPANITDMEIDDVIQYNNAVKRWLDACSAPPASDESGTES